MLLSECGSVVLKDGKEDGLGGDGDEGAGTRAVSRLEIGSSENGPRGS